MITFLSSSGSALNVLLVIHPCAVSIAFCLAVFLEEKDPHDSNSSNFIIFFQGFLNG